MFVNREFVGGDKKRQEVTCVYTETTWAKLAVTDILGFVFSLHHQHGPCNKPLFLYNA